MPHMPLDGARAPSWGVLGGLLGALEAPGVNPKSQYVSLKNNKEKGMILAFPTLRS